MKRARCGVHLAEIAVEKADSAGWQRALDSWNMRHPILGKAALAALRGGNAALASAQRIAASGNRIE
jgi:hypothetical protein